MTTPVGGMSVFGGIGKLEWAPTNAPDDPFPTYVDITPYVRTEQTDLQINRGRDSELNAFQPGQLTCILDNSDFRFTFGNTSGPYGANWQPAKQVRYSETIGSRTFVLFKGWIEYPDIPSWLPIGYQEVQLTATDRLARLARGRTFVSTLAEHILYNAPSLGISAYWPLVASTGLTAWPLTPPQVPLSTPTVNLTANVAAAGTAATSFAGTPPPGDDAQTLRLMPQVVNSTVLSDVFVAGPVNSITVSNTTVTMSVWIYYEDVAPTSSLFFQVDDGVLTNLFNLQRNPTWSFGANLSGGTQFVLVACNQLPSWKWNLLTLRLTLPSGLVEMWMNDSPAVSGTCSGSPPASITFTEPTIQGIQGNVAHLQIYLGTQFTRAAHLAQYQMGLLGLEAQTTGQRVNTILNYAGVSATDRQVDNGVSYMAKATLVGRAPADLLAEAVTAEQGRGFALGTGPYAFHDRQRVMNV